MARADRLVLGMPSLFDLGSAARRASARARIAVASERVELARARVTSYFVPGGDWLHLGRRKRGKPVYRFVRG